MLAKRQCDGSHAAGFATRFPCRYYHTHRLALSDGGFASLLP
jgi:hypothetical protein